MSLRPLDAMKLLTFCVLLRHLPRLCGGAYSKSSFYYFACKFDDSQVKPLLLDGYQFYEYLQQDPLLWKEYSKHMNPASKNRGKDYLNRHYSHGHDELHTTMFFGLTPAALEAYERRPEVQKALGRSLELHIYGLFITPNTMGFRMALPSEALPLWDTDDKTKPIHEPVCSDIEIFSDHSLPDGEKVFAPTNFTRGSRAHATVLTSDQAAPVQTGLDLVDIEFCEQKCRNDPHFRAVQLENGWSAKMRYYGFGRFVFYFDSRVPVLTKFLKMKG